MGVVTAPGSHECRAQVGVAEVGTLQAGHVVLLLLLLLLLAVAAAGGGVGVVAVVVPKEQRPRMVGRKQKEKKADIIITSQKQKARSQNTKTEPSTKGARPVCIILWQPYSDGHEGHANVLQQCLSALRNRHSA